MSADLQGRLDAEFPPPVILEEGQSVVGTYLRLEQERLPSPFILSRLSHAHGAMGTDQAR